MKEIKAKETRTRVYISGPITGTPDYMERFAAAEEACVQRGYAAYNPAKILMDMPAGTTHEEYMEICMVILGMCDMVYMLPGWEGSPGANREYGYAMAMGMDIWFPGSIAYGTAI